ncbi:hypothetical protein [Pseudomonas ogarae]|uniref:hypothetical protein n=1 Tax=Pseudomonas ogarae (strain DSM 112162 / CECT 30235 / F113) TaxID=1114970 RepID=UPI0006991E8D|nr:hypothetical protein [Pseudomonas ogarae]
MRAPDHIESTSDAQLVILKKMISLISEQPLHTLDVINWAAPIPYFGDPCKATIATVGLNPSDREFVSSEGTELNDSSRRFHTLTSLGLASWNELTLEQLESIHTSCAEYFSRNPYDAWFKPLDLLLSGTNDSFYSPLFHACHLDLIPYATCIKWAFLKTWQRDSLLTISAGFLGQVLKYSPIKMLVLNGKTVVENFERACDVSFHKEPMDAWCLPRKNGNHVSGFSYEGKISRMADINIGRDVYILGYNHNIQSSYGVTSSVRTSIQEWISQKAKEILN